MKKRVWITCIAVLLPLHVLFGINNEIETNVESSIDRATVYLNGAQLTRTATVQLEPGRNELVFTGLSRYIDPATIQLSGTGEFLILSLNHQVNYLSEHPEQEKLQRLIEIRDSLQKEIDRKNVSIQILDRELTILMNNTDLKGTDKNLTAAELEQAMNYFRDKLTEIEEKKLEIQDTLTLLNEELEKVKRQINEMNSGRRESTSEIRAILQTDSGQSSTLTLTYLVNNASWYPTYDVRVQDIRQPIEFFYRANIRQQTGVEWNNVRLTVSSALPERGGRLPEMNPWYIDFYEPRPLEQQEPAVRMRREADEAKVSGNLADVVTRPTVPTEFVQNQTSFSYNIDVPYSVPSGGNPLTVDIQRHEMDAVYRYFASPKLQQRAYLTARIPNWQEYNLLPGETNLFFENTYVGKTSINPQVTGDTLAFSLGKDPSVVVDRTKLREFEEKNFFGSKIRESFAWQIEVRNTKKQPVQIEIEDQVPVSQNEDIEVDLIEGSGADFNRETGRLAWNTTIAPGETYTVRFEYRIEYPRGKQVRY